MDKKNSDKDQEKSTKTESDKIWSEIKNKKIEMFALPNQVVSKYCRPVTIDPSRLYVIPTAASLLPALEIALGDKFTIEMADKYFIISRVSK